MLSQDTFTFVSKMLLSMPSISSTSAQPSCLANSEYFNFSPFLLAFCLAALALAALAELPAATAAARRAAALFTGLPGLFAPALAGTEDKFEAEWEERRRLPGRLLWRLFCSRSLRSRWTRAAVELSSPLALPLLRLPIMGTAGLRTFALTTAPALLCRS